MSSVPSRSGDLAADPRLAARFRRFSQAAAVAPIVVGACVLTGWALDVEVLKSVAPGLVSMKPNAGLAFILTGAGLVTVLRAGDRPPRAGQAAAGLAVLIGLATLTQHLLGWNLGIDELLFSDPADPGPHPGRMAPTAAAGLAALGGAVLLTGAGRYRVAGLLAAPAALTGFIAALGYLYRVPVLYRLPDQPGMALHTSLTLLVTALGVMVVRPERLAISARNAGGTLLRKLFPAMVGALVVLGWLQVEAQRRAIADPAGETSVMVALRLVVLSGLIAWTAASLRKVEQGRLAAERDLRNLNLELEERVEARTRQLKASEEQLRLLAEAAKVGIFHRNEQGRCIYVNPEWSAITGLTYEQAMGDGWAEAAHPDERERVRAAWNEAGENRTDVHLRYRVRTPEGVERWVVTHAVAIRPDAGSPIRGWVGTMTDVSSQVEAEKAIAEARDRALEASRSKSEFLATMSHEIRTPMNGVVGLTGLLLDTRLNETQRSYAEGIKTSGEALLSIINDILDFSKIEAGKLELEEVDFSIPEAVRQVGGLVAEPARAKGLELVAECSPDTPAAVRGDVGRLRQILLNFASNAVKFTASGRVLLRAFPDPEPAGGRVAMRFEVADTGPGIDPGDAERLFEPFAQGDASTTRRFGGTGLGLAICRRLAQAMGGTVGVDSTPGSGSTFWLRLVFDPAEEPLPAPERPAGTGEVPAASPTPGLTRRRVLIVEDHPINQQVAAGMVDRLGYTSHLARNGAEALAALESGHYDAVLMDCHMPEMDGFQATREIRRREAGGPRTPVIAMTAGALAEDREQCAAAGMDDYLVKPIQDQDLGALLARWVPVSGGGQPPAAAPEPDREILDLEQIELLHQLGAGDTDPVARLVTVFEEQAAAGAEKLRSARENGDRRLVGELAHSLKGSAATMGAARAAEACRALELAAGGTSDIAGALDTALAELERAAAALREHAGRRTAEFPAGSPGP